MSTSFRPARGDFFSGQVLVDRPGDLLSPDSRCANAGLGRRPAWHTTDRPLRDALALGTFSGVAPLLERKDYGAASVFRPENMLREARRQKALDSGHVPPICVLDPDGDVVSHVWHAFATRPCPTRACYHTRMWEWTSGGIHCGIVGQVVGGSFSVPIAEQLFASGCGLLVSLASAGQITDAGPPPYYIQIEPALRDEGTSYHYLSPSAYAGADAALLALALGAFASAGQPVRRGATWTTDAPFRETAGAIEIRRRQGILAVEMEAAALCLYGSLRPAGHCLAHVSNQLGCREGDFEKGENNGAGKSLDLIMALARAWSTTGRHVSELTTACHA